QEWPCSVPPHAPGFLNQLENVRSAELLQLAVSCIARLILRLSPSIEIVAMAGVGQVELERRRRARLRGKNKALAVGAAVHQPFRATIGLLNRPGDAMQLWLLLRRRGCRRDENTEDC